MKKRRGRKRKLRLDTLLKLKEKGRNEAYKYGRLFDSPEDASQEYAMRLLEGKHSRATVSQAFIDMAREVGGRDGQPGAAKRNVAMALPVEDRVLDFFSGTYELNADTMIFFKQILNKLRQRDRRLLELYLQGFTFGEIAEHEEFQCTESYVNQLFWKVIDGIREDLKEY